MLNTIMRLARCVMFFTVAFLGQSGRAEEDGIDIFLKAVISQQIQSPITSGAISYEKKVTIGDRTEEEIKKESDQLIADFKNDVPDHPYIKEIISGVPERVRAAYSRTRTISGRFRFDYSQKGCKFAEDQFTYEDFPESPLRSIKKQVSGRFSDRTEAAMELPLSSTIFVGSTAPNMVQFHQLGRLRGILVTGVSAIVEGKGERVAKEEIRQHFKKICEDNRDISVLKIAEIKPFEDGSTSYTLESAVADKVTQRFTIVPSMGYICPKIEFYDPSSGNLVKEYEAKEFVKLPRSGIFYPTHYTESDYNASTGKLTKKVEITIHQETLSLNEPMSPKDFSLEVPEGFRVYDSRDGGDAHYTAEEAGVLTLESDGLDLDKKPWLRKTTEGLPRKNSSVPKQRIAARVILMAIGFGFIIWGVIVRIRKKKSAVFTALF
ncbi:MAG: hypothetical protein IJH68_00430 [Thermoguttaceae bacterium]|nr:hypothetical protein [Thermoguttaceae bacterium]